MTVQTVQMGTHLLGLDQSGPLGDLSVHWTGGDADEVDVGEEYDDYDDSAGGESVAPDASETPGEDQ